MFDSETVKALGQWPILQFAAVVITMIAGIYAIRRGEKDRKPEQPIPQWMMMGPMHDMMEAVHNMAEQGRQQTDLLRRIDDHMADILRQAEMNKSTLEAIRNESRLR